MTTEPRNVEAEIHEKLSERLSRIVAASRALDETAEPWRLVVEAGREEILRTTVADVLDTVEALVEDVEHRRRVLLRLVDSHAGSWPWPDPARTRIAEALGTSTLDELRAAMLDKDAETKDPFSALRFLLWVTIGGAATGRGIVGFPLSKSPIILTTFAPTVTVGRASTGADVAEEAPEARVAVSSFSAVGEEVAPYFFAPDLAPKPCLEWALERLGIRGGPSLYDGRAINAGIVAQALNARGFYRLFINYDAKGLASYSAGGPSEVPTGEEGTTVAAHEGMGAGSYGTGRHFLASTLALVAHAAMLETVDALAAEAAKQILREATGDELAKHENALGRLEQATRERLAEVRGAIGLPLSVEEMRTLGERDGLYELDARLVPLLQHIGERGRKTASDVRKKATRDKWARWADDRLRLPCLLARALWLDKVRPSIERATSRHDTAGLPMPVLTNFVAASRRLVAASRRGAQEVLPLVDETKREAVLTDYRGRRVGSLRFGAEIDGRHVKLAALGKLSTQRLVRHLLGEGYRRKWIDEEAEAHRIVIEGGYGELAALLGMNGSKAANEVKEAMATLASIHIDTPTGEGQVFAYWHHKAHTGQPARLEMHLLGPFAPDYISRELEGHRRAADKYLVPVPLPRLLPPLVGRANEHAAQAHLQLLALRELRMNAKELAECGAVEIGERKWRDLADEAGLPRSLLPSVLNAYPTGDGERPPFLLRPSDWRFDLAGDYGAERGSILHAASAQQWGAVGGRASAAKRRRGGKK